MEHQRKWVKGDYSLELEHVSSAEDGKSWVVKTAPADPQNKIFPALFRNAFPDSKGEEIYQRLVSWAKEHQFVPQP